MTLCKKILTAKKNTKVFDQSLIMILVHYSKVFSAVDLKRI